MEFGSYTINGVAVISCSCEKNYEIIQNILKVEKLPEAIKVTDHVDSYPWHVETKYYTAILHLLAIKEKNLVNQEFSQNIEAVLIQFDNQEADSFEEVQRWLPFIEMFEPSVKLLTCNNYSADGLDGVPKCNVQNWCLKNQFELIELHPNEDSDEEDAIKDTKGYARVIQALHANAWSDLQLKDPPRYQPSADVISSLNAERISFPDHSFDAQLAGNSSADDSESAKQQEKATAEKIDALFEEDKWLFDAVGQEDPGGEAFEAMFSRILNMKEKATSLNGDEKKLYAEKVAIEFWKALGGEEEEIAGLSSDEN